MNRSFLKIDNAKSATDFQEQCTGPQRGGAGEANWPRATGSKRPHN